MFLGNWNEYYFASLLTVSDSQRTLPIALAFFTSEFSYNYTQLFAALTIVILPWYHPVCACTGSGAGQRGCFRRQGLMKRKPDYEI